MPAYDGFGPQASIEFVAPAPVFGGLRSRVNLVQSYIGKIDRKFA